MQDAPVPSGPDITCKQCGVTSKLPELFVDESTVRNGPGEICVTCKAYKDMFPQFYLNAAFVVAATLFLGFNVSGSAAGSVIFAVSAYAAMYASIVLHELGHACAALLVGVKVPVFSLGGGRHVRVFRTSKRWLIVGLLPTEGLILVLNDARNWYRLKSFFITLAGPLTNLICAAYGYSWLEESGQALSAYPTLALQLFVVFSLISGISNLIPFSTVTPHGPMDSDGKSIIRLLTMTPEQIDEQIRALNTIQAYLEYLYGDKAEAVKLIDPIVANDDADIAARILASGIYAESDALQKGVEICRSTLGLAGLDAANRAILLNNLAYLLSREATPESLAEADELSKEAFEIAPVLLPIRSTRASVHVALQRPADAIALTMDKRYKVESKMHQAHVLCTQALAYSQLGTADLANESLQQAQRLAPDDQQVAETRAAIAAG